VRSGRALTRAARARRPLASTPQGAELRVLFADLHEKLGVVEIAAFAGVGAAHGLPEALDDASVNISFDAFVDIVIAYVRRRGSILCAHGAQHLDSYRQAEAGLAADASQAPADDGEEDDDEEDDEEMPDELRVRPSQRTQALSTAHSPAARVSAAPSRAEPSPAAHSRCAHSRRALRASSQAVSRRILSGQTAWLS
jgi:hypothetical protein